ncbi:MAG TPA: energy-coupling factor transporter transmembrane component T [Ktedonobacterales bacterium]|nr:energy-coupling factor transporter transmembrane component T [Ktedonobacterales bacterium]
MLSNLPIGVYTAGATPIHRLQARTKLLVLVWLALAFFVANHKRFHYGTYATAFVMLALALLLARVDAGYIWRRMRLLVILLAIGIPISLAFTPGDTWHTFGPVVATLGGHSVPIGPVVVTYDGIWFTMSLSAIFLLLYLGSMTLTLTTTPVALAEGVMLLLRPLRRLGLPVDEFGLMTLVALRFIPVLLQEAEQLVKAQLSRGADFSTGSLPSRVRALGSLLVPMLQGALRRAEGLSAALESRGYGVTSEATLLHEGRLRWLDWLVLVAVPAVTIAAYLLV